MKNIIVPFVLFSILTSVGCANDDASESTGNEPANQSVIAPTIAPSTITPVIADSNANKMKPASSTILPITIPSQPAAGAGLNPAHGQPGHRCEIAVGAPLDSKPTQPSIQAQPVATTTTTTPITASPVTTSPSSTGKGLNPAHGQPGHRCDISVGAPLDSKPIQTTIQAPPTTATTTNVPPSVTPTQVKPATSPFLTPSATGKGLNPAHGQPGHRCDISVGAPLNSKPAN